MLKCQFTVEQCIPEPKMWAHAYLKLIQGRRRGGLLGLGDAAQYQLHAPCLVLRHLRLPSQALRLPLQDDGGVLYHPEKYE